MCLEKIQNKLKAPKNQFNAFGKYYYRSCEDILEALKPILADHNATLTISDSIENIGNRYYVKATATLGIKDKGTVSVTAYAREEEDKKGMDGSQITGAASSYARKYALNGLFLIDDTKDADTQHNSKEEPKKATEPAKQTEPKPKTTEPQAEDKQLTMQKEIGGWLCEMYGGIVAAEDKLEELGSFTNKQGKVVKGKRSVFDLGTKENDKGQSQTSITHSKVHKMYEEWQATEAHNAHAA
jgi:FtsZ-interacting cell division protein YlmF